MTGKGAVRAASDNPAADTADRGRSVSVETTEAVLLALARVVEHRDRMNLGHCERIAFLSAQLGLALGLRPEDLSALQRGGYLHDIGKVGLPDAILLKPSALTEPEWTEMRLHPIVGEEICRPLPSLAPVLPIIRSHHERWDGSGYPDRLHGNQIPLLARVLQLADIYDALTTERSYKPALPHQSAIQIMQEECDCGWRDPEIMAAFRDVCRSLRKPESPIANLARSLDLSQALPIGRD